MTIFLAARFTVIYAFYIRVEKMTTDVFFVYLWIWSEIY